MADMKDLLLGAGVPIAPDRIDALNVYHDLLIDWNMRMDLTSVPDAEIARRHFLDSLLPLTKTEFFPEGLRLIDVGTGAGFPGLALKIACPDLRLTLLDSLDKRIGFLRECCEKLELADANCVHARAEEAPAEFRAAFDVATSRAVARLRVLCELCLPLVKKGGLFLAMKGPDVAEELEEAKAAVCLLGGSVERVFDYEIPGTDVHHTVVAVRKTGDTPAKYPRPWAQIKKKPL